MADAGKETRESYDVTIVGAGPAGYSAAIRAAQLGLSVALVEKRDRLGGTCLNVGCIPSKALLDSTELFQRCRSGLEPHGIGVSGVKLDLAAMMERKGQVVEKFTSGLATIMKKRKVTVVHGEAEVLSSTRVRAAAVDADGTPTREWDTGAVVLATGSEPQSLPFMELDGKRIVSSTEALAFDSVPKSLVVIGAGAIGLEMGSVWSRLGADVTVVEIMPSVLPGWDRQVSQVLKRELAKQGMDIRLSTRVTDAKVGRKGVSLKTETGSGDQEELRGDVVLLAVGRRPSHGGLDLEKLGVKTDDGARVVVDERFQTSAEGIYAVGDLIPGPMLAHKGEEEGIAVAEILAGRAGHVGYDTIPNVVYTWPEAASAGRSEQQLEQDEVPYNKGAFSFGANGRALAMGDPSGFVKILAHGETDRVLGVHIVGPWASSLIAEAVAVMEFGGSAEDIARTVHAHPTLPEVVKEAALAVDGRPIHGL